jgi:hypothetical protein
MTAPVNQIVAISSSALPALVAPAGERASMRFHKDGPPYS